MRSPGAGARVVALVAATSVLVAAASAFGCTSAGLAVLRLLPDRGCECPGPLVPTQEIPGDLVLRQSARVEAEGVDWRLTLVTQKRDDALVLVGLDALGGKAFVVTQRGTDVAVERPRGRLPLPPVNLLRDVHRVRFAAPGSGLEAEGAAPGADGGAVVVRHPECGYTVTLVTVEETPLPARLEETK